MSSKSPSSAVSRQTAPSRATPSSRWPCARAGDTNPVVRRRSGGSGTPGTGANVSYFFTTDSGWSASEKAAWQGGLALWSAVANIKFAEAADAASANFVITRGNDGAFARFPDQNLSVIGAGTLADTSPSAPHLDGHQRPGFGPIGAGPRGARRLSTVDGRARDRPHHRARSRRPVQRRRQRRGVAVQPLRHQAMDDDVVHLAMHRPTKYFDQYPVAGTNWGSVFDAGRDWSYDRLRRWRSTSSRPSGSTARRPAVRWHPAARSSASTPTSRAISAGSTISPSTASGHHLVERRHGQHAGPVRLLVGLDDQPGTRHLLERRRPHQQHRHRLRHGHRDRHRRRRQRHDPGQRPQQRPGREAPATT